MNFKNILLRALIAAPAVMAVLPQSQALPLITMISPRAHYEYPMLHMISSSMNQNTENWTKEQYGALTEQFRADATNERFAKETTNPIFKNSTDKAVLALIKLMELVRESVASVFTNSELNDYESHVSDDTNAKKVEKFFADLNVEIGSDMFDLLKYVSSVTSISPKFPKYTFTEEILFADSAKLDKAIAEAIGTEDLISDE